MCTNNYIGFDIYNFVSEICTSVQTAFALLNNSCTCPLLGGIFDIFKIVLDISQVQHHIYEYNYSFSRYWITIPDAYHIGIMDSQYNTVADLVAQWICTTIIIRRPGLGLDVYICTYRCTHPGPSRGRRIIIVVL